MRYDSVLLVAFGGPTAGCCEAYDSDTCPSEAYCFVEGIVGTAASQRERVKDIASHYVALGGFSPFNALTFKQARALEIALRARDVSLRVYAGFRHWRPYLEQVISEMAANGHRNILGIIMAPHQSSVSWDWYQQVVEKAINAVAGEKPRIDYLDPWFAHPGYVGAIAEQVKAASSEKLARAEVVFTAHAIPQPSPKRSGNRDSDWRTRVRRKTHLYYGRARILMIGSGREKQKVLTPLLPRRLGSFLTMLKSSMI